MNHPDDLKAAVEQIIRDAWNHNMGAGYAVSACRQAITRWVEEDVFEIPPPLAETLTRKS